MVLPQLLAPTCLYAVEGLARYGFEREARRLAGEWLQAVAATFRTTGNLWEKYNVLDGSTDVSAEYDTPAMLGWTAGTFICLDDYLSGSLTPEPLPEQLINY